MASALQTQIETLIATQTIPAPRPTIRNTYITQLPQQNPARQGPLRGVPISLKDCFDLQGTVTTVGSHFYARHNPIAEKNSWIAQRLLDVGATIPGKTHL